MNAPDSISFHPGYTRYLAVSVTDCLVASLVMGLADRLGQSYWIGILGVVATVRTLTFFEHQWWTYH